MPESVQPAAPPSHSQDPIPVYVTPPGSFSTHASFSALPTTPYFLERYSPEKRRDDVRLIVTIGLLFMLAWLVVWACVESRSWPEHWKQTKEMLQIILPALTGLFGSVFGFYFGSAAASRSDDPPSQDNHS